LETKSRLNRSNEDELAELSTGENGDTGAWQGDLEQLKKSSQSFIGKWNKLVSTTNWEKGAIIVKWRESLIEQESPATEYSDEAWARLVGGVTSQHVGRLRRVHQRFSDTYQDYKGLYWTHFHAATEWDDAEMWLEGAVQSKWSVSQMRAQRWETMGSLEADRPDDADIVTSELDEDFEPANREKPHSEALGSDDYDQISGPRLDGPDFGDEAYDAKAENLTDEQDDEVNYERPFENLAELPEDLAEAFEAYKLAILRHKAADWEEISREDVLASLDALKHLAKAQG
jgi:hypothetical protein